MFQRALFVSLLTLASLGALSATIVAASGLTERIDAYRMTVLKTNPVTGRFQCVEHLKWAAVEKTDLHGLQPGDIVRVEPRPNGRARLVLLRTAADEIASPER